MSQRVIEKLNEVLNVEFKQIGDSTKYYCQVLDFGINLMIEKYDNSDMITILRENDGEFLIYLTEDVFNYNSELMISDRLQLVMKSIINNNGFGYVEDKQCYLGWGNEYEHPSWVNRRIYAIKRDECGDEVSLYRKYRLCDYLPGYDDDYEDQYEDEIEEEREYYQEDDYEMKVIKTLYK